VETLKRASPCSRLSTGGTTAFPVKCTTKLRFEAAKDEETNNNPAAITVMNENRRVILISLEELVTQA